MSQRRPGRKRKSLTVTLSAAHGPTAQRIQHANARCQVIAVEVYQTDAGEETQLRRMRIISPLEHMWKAGLIANGQYAGARRYQTDADMAAVAGPASTVRYELRWIDGGSDRFLLPIEAAADHLKRLAAAQMACGLESRLMLDWIAADMTGWRHQARIWFGGVNEDTRQRTFLSLLRVTCDSLESHYRRRS